ncbi:MAG: hypothetical protein JWP36_2512 [Paucimonas sp.]|nr:hypothetical protein [Paucimonas sp.]
MSTLYWAAPGEPPALSMMPPLVVLVPVTGFIVMEQFEHEPSTAKLPKSSVRIVETIRVESAATALCSGAVARHKAVIKT